MEKPTEWKYFKDCPLYDESDTNPGPHWIRHFATGLNGYVSETQNPDESYRWCVRDEKMPDGDKYKRDNASGVKEAKAEAEKVATEVIHCRAAAC